MRIGDVVNIKYRHPSWQTVGVVSCVYTPDSIQVTVLCPHPPDYFEVGIFDLDELELLGHIDLEEGEKQNANRR